jgi:two-component system, sensor histidine kinase and response regulator
MTDSDFSKGDILIVDDTPDNLRLLSAMLDERGYEVRSVKNGSSALMGVKAAPPDLILLDINMPGLNGYQVCQRLKDNPQSQNIPVIFISAYNEVFDKVKAFQVGGVDYITKPFQAEEVLVRIENQLIVRRLQEKLLKALEKERALNQRIEEMAAVEERNRIARDIHDSLGHSLVALKIQIETTATLWDKNPDKAYEFLQQAKQLSAEALRAVRLSVSDLRQDPLQGKMLEEAIANLVNEFQRTSKIQPQLKINLAQPLSNQISTAIYRLIQEGLTNIYKYAEATAVQICIETTDKGLLVTLRDNGKGFCTDGNYKGFGLQGMRERITAVQGQLNIVSQPNAGCIIEARFPRLSA